MRFIRQQWIPWLLTLAALAVLYFYYHYSLKQIPEKVAQSTETIINVDKIRFSFKVSLLSQKGFSAYAYAVTQQSEDKLYDALDYLEAALGFLDIAYTKSEEQVAYIQPRLLEAIELIEQHRLAIQKPELERVQSLIHEVYWFSEQRERKIWSEVQNNYIEFQTDEYKQHQLYKVAVLVFLALLSLSVWLYLQQRGLNRLIRKHQSELKSLAYFDTLTRVPNRKSIENLLGKQVNRALRHQKKTFIALIDLDDFKKVNDLLGHDAGDALLVESVHRIKRAIREEDTVGRLGGDEFLIVFDEDVTEEVLMLILDRIFQAFQNPIRVNNTEFVISLSIGLASAPDNSRQVEELIKFADIAMYQSKHRGRGQYQFYDRILSQRLQQEHDLNLEIKRALKQGEFELYYQPQIDTKTHQVVSAEALVRWNHPERGLIMPGEFIDLIEKGFHTQAFGNWVMTRAIEQQKAWQREGIQMNVAVNLSVKHILMPDFYQSIHSLIERLDANLHHLIFEITEYEVIEYKSRAIKVLNDLHRDGFKFHLDDFGTGYSSISYLSQLPIGAIKIDKSFIDYIQPGNDQKLLVDAIINVGHALGITMIAEGVEEPYQLEYLKQKSCSVAQGYLFSKPLPRGDFEQFVRVFNGLE